MAGGRARAEARRSELDAGRVPALRNHGIRWCFQPPEAAMEAWSPESIAAQALGWIDEIDNEPCQSVYDGGPTGGV